MSLHSSCMKSQHFSSLLGKGWSLREAILAPNEPNPDAFLCLYKPFQMACQKVHIQVDRLGSYRSSFSLGCFIIEDIRLGPRGQFSYIVFSDQSLAPVVWPLSKARRMLRSSFESLRNVLRRKWRLSGSSQRQSLFSINIMRGDCRHQIYSAAILSCNMCIVERGQIRRKHSRETFQPGVEVP